MAFAVHDGAAAVALLEGDGGVDLPCCVGGAEGLAAFDAKDASGGGVAGEVAAVGEEGGAFCWRLGGELEMFAGSEGKFDEGEVGSSEAGDESNGEGFEISDGNALRLIGVAGGKVDWAGVGEGEFAGAGRLEFQDGDVAVAEDVGGGEGVSIGGEEGGLARAGGIESLLVEVDDEVVEELHGTGLTELVDEGLRFPSREKFGESFGFFLAGGAVGVEGLAGAEDYTEEKAETGDGITHPHRR
jgi:hypothetical protein